MTVRFEDSPCGRSWNDFQLKYSSQEELDGVREVDPGRETFITLGQRQRFFFRSNSSGNDIADGEADLKARTFTGFAHSEDLTCVSRNYSVRG